MLFLLCISALVLVGLPVLYQKRSQVLWYRDIKSRGLETLGTVTALEPLMGKASGRGFLISTAVRLTVRFEAPLHAGPMTVTLVVNAKDLARARKGLGSTVAVRYLEHLPSEAVLAEVPCRPA